jgi:hypothetical protein
MSEKHQRVVLGVSVFLLGSLLLSACERRKPAPPPPIPVHSGEDFFPARTRVVWCRQVINNGNDPFGYGANFILMGKDFTDDTEPRIIAEAVDSYRKPLFTEDGQRLVYTDMPENKVKVINWEGGDPTTLKTGMAMEVWRDPSGIDWVYYAPSFVEKWIGNRFSR